MKTNKPTVQVRVRKVGVKPKPSKTNLQVAPAAIARSVKSTGVPRVKVDGSVTRISHSEWCLTVTGGAAFECHSFSVNPGISSLFPWLSQVAQRYETYKFRRLEARYHPAVPTITSGVVGMCMDFDALDSAPSSYLKALSYQDKWSGPCWGEGCMKADAALDRQPTKFIRSGLPPSLSDLKTMDLGNLQVFTEGLPAGTSCGHIEIVYVVDLFIPQIENGVGGRWTASGQGLGIGALVGDQAYFVPDSRAVSPFVWLSTSDLSFVQPFEGVVTVMVTGNTLSNSVMTFSSSTGTATLLGGSASATVQIGVAAVRLLTGSTLRAAITAGVPTNVIWLFSLASYDSLL